MKFKEKKGDLIMMAIEGRFDVIAHGCNCFCIQKAGIALQMDNAFGTNNSNKYRLESKLLRGMIDKLGRVEVRQYNEKLAVANCYTQYNAGPNAQINALRLCLQKLNHQFKGKGFHLGLPWMGCGIGGLEIDMLRHLIKLELTGFKKVTLIEYEKS